MSDGRVIEFPTWRRAASGAPGVDTDGPGEDTSRQVEARAGGVGGLDEPVWHEGASTTGDVVVRLRADLLGIAPPIWRRLEIRGSMTLDVLHPVLAAAFGWPREGEYRFREVVRGERSTRLGTTFVNAWTQGRAYGPEEWTVPVGRLLATPRSRLRYGYGAIRRRGFEISVVAEDIIPLPPTSVGEVPMARLVGGRRQGPPAEFGTPAAYALALSHRMGAPGAGLVKPAATLDKAFDPAAVDLSLLAARVSAAGDAAGVAP